MEADIMIVKMTPTMEFSGPKMSWKTLMYATIKIKLSVPKRNLSRTGAGILNRMFMNVCISFVLADNWIVVDFDYISYIIKEKKS